MIATWGIESWFRGSQMTVHVFAGEPIVGRFSEITEGCIRLDISDEEVLFVPQERVLYVRVRERKEGGEDE